MNNKPEIVSSYFKGCLPAFLILIICLFIMEHIVIRLAVINVKEYKEKRLNLDIFFYL